MGSKDGRTLDREMARRGFCFYRSPSLLLPVAHHWGGKRGPEA